MKASQVAFWRSDMEAEEVLPRSQGGAEKGQADRRWHIPLFKLVKTNDVNQLPGVGHLLGNKHEERREKNL